MYYIHTYFTTIVFSSFQFSHSAMFDSLGLHELQHTRPPCPSPAPRVHPNPCPLSRWCHPAISSSVTLFSSCPQSFPASGSFPMSQLFASGGQSIGVSASTSVFPILVHNFKLGNIHFGTGYMCSKFFSWWLCSMHAQIESDSLWHHRLCLAGYSVHGIFQARILECVAILFSRESSWLRARTGISCIAGRFFTTELPGSPFLIVVYDKKYLRPVYNIMNFSWTWLISFLLISLIA